MKTMPFTIGIVQCHTFSFRVHHSPTRPNLSGPSFCWEGWSIDSRFLSHPRVQASKMRGVPPSPAAVVQINVINQLNKARSVSIPPRPDHPESRSRPAYLWRASLNLGFPNLVERGLVHGDVWRVACRYACWKGPARSLRYKRPPLYRWTFLSWSLEFGRLFFLETFL